MVEKSQSGPGELNPVLEAGRRHLVRVIAASVTAWWEMIFRFWIQGAAGQFGKEHSTAINPNI